MSMASFAKSYVSHAGALIMWILALWFRVSVVTMDDLLQLLSNGDITQSSHTLVQAKVPIWPLLVYDILSSITCILSALAHTFACMPRPVSSFFWKLDQLGISFGAHSLAPRYIYYVHVQTSYKMSTHEIPRDLRTTCHSVSALRLVAMTS